MTRYLIDDLEKWTTFSKRLEGRVSHIAHSAKVDVQIQTNGVHNAYKHWLRQYDKAVDSGLHRRIGVNVLQMKIDILFRSFLNRSTLKVTARHPIHRATTNVVNLFKPETSSGFVDYAGIIKFQNLFCENPSEYLALDFCGSIYRDIAATMGENPFGESEIAFQVVLQMAANDPQIMSNQDLFKLMRLKPLPPDVPVRTTSREQ